MYKVLSEFCKPYVEQRKKNISIHNSLLTPSRYPIEVNFRSDDQSLVFTIDPFGVDGVVGSKLAYCCEILDIRDLDSQLLSILTQQPNQRFGCWVSLRHSPHGLSYKLYYEITPTLSQFFLSELVEKSPQMKSLCGFVPILGGLSIDLKTISEFYCRIENPSYNKLHLLFVIAKVENQLPCVINYLSWLTSSPHPSFFSSTSIGFSLNYSNEVPVLTLFVHAAQVFNSNVLARQQLINFSNQIDGDFTAYELLTKELEHHPINNPLHSTISIKVTSKSLSLSVGISPW
jgi:hypothetical protein